MARTVHRDAQTAQKAKDYMPTAWHRQPPTGSGTVDLTLPSGQDALVRLVTMDDLVLERVFLAPPVELRPDIVDRILAAIVLKPAVKVAPNSPASRARDQVYTDMIDDADRAVILTASGVLP